MLIRHDELQQRVLRACRERLWNDQLVEEFVRQFTAVVNRSYGEAQGAVIASHGELAKVESEIAKLVQSIKAGVPGELLKDEALALQARREALTAKWLPGALRSRCCTRESSGSSTMHGSTKPARH